MELLLFSLLASVIFVVSAMLFQIQRRKERRRRLDGLELRPNCLLTRHPIVFLAGRRSLFRPFEHWNEIPAYLREHGYDVWVLEPASHSRVEALIEALDSLSGKCHLIADSSSHRELEELSRAQHAKIVSLTCVRNPSRAALKRNSSPSVDDLRPLRSAIEFFDLESSFPTLRGWKDKLALACLEIHNRIFLERGRRVDPFETGEVETQNAFAIESSYLDLAVQLAERDLRYGSD